MQIIFPPYDRQAYNEGIKISQGKDVSIDKYVSKEGSVSVALFVLDRSVRKPTLVKHEEWIICVWYRL